MSNFTFDQNTMAKMEKYGLMQKIFTMSNLQSTLVHVIIGNKY